MESDASVESLKHSAQSALGTGKGRLLNSSGDVLDGANRASRAAIYKPCMLSKLKLSPQERVILKPLLSLQF